MASTLCLLLLIVIYPSYNLAQSCVELVHGTCMIECVGEDACKAATVQCNPHYPCAVICDGKAACSDAIISGNEATPLYVHCRGENACKSASIQCGAHHQCVLNCDPSYNICDGIHVNVNSALSFQCFNQCPNYVFAQVYTPHPTIHPSLFPTDTPTNNPTSYPTRATTTTARPTLDAFSDTTKSTVFPTNPPSTSDPTNRPTHTPTNNPTHSPTKLPTQRPTTRPTTEGPTTRPTQWVPTPWPIQRRTEAPAKGPTHEPSGIPTQPPTNTPTKVPTHTPTHPPTNNPIRTPMIEYESTKTWTLNPSLHPTTRPTHIPATETPIVPTSTNDTYTSSIQSQTTVDDYVSNCSSLRLSAVDLSNVPSNISTNVRIEHDSRVSHGIVARLRFYYKLNSNDATNIVEIVTDTMNNVIRHIIPSRSNCFDSDGLNTQYLLRLDDMVVDISMFVCDEQQQLLKYVLDTNTNHIICHIVHAIHRQVGLQIPINGTTLRSHGIMIYKDRIESTALSPDRDGNILHGVVNSDYYGKHGNHLQITLLVIAGILAFTSIIISVFILILSSKKLREQVNNPKSISEIIEMNITTHDKQMEASSGSLQSGYLSTYDKQRVACGSEEMEAVHSSSQGSPTLNHLSTIAIERTDYMHREGIRHETDDPMNDICDINGVWVTRSMKDGYMLNHSAYDISPSTDRPYELSPKRAMV